MLSVALAFALAGCKLIALGDSNTCLKFYDTMSCKPDFLWPGLLQRRVWWRGWRVVNRGVPGMMAGRHYKLGNDIFTPTGEYAFAGYHLEKLLVEERLARACRWLVVPAFSPIVVIAVGTNDTFLGPPDDQIALEVLALAARIAEVAPCTRTFIGLMPPVKQPAQAAKIEQENAILRARVPADRLIDLYTGFGPDDLESDGVHMTLAAQQKRADRVWQAIWGAGGTP